MEKAVLRVEGMSCQHCVKAVTEAVGELPGVAEVAVDLPGGTLACMFDPARSRLEDIAAAVVDAGYEVRGG